MTDARSKSENDAWDTAGDFLHGAVARRQMRNLRRHSFGEGKGWKLVRKTVLSGDLPTESDPLVESSQSELEACSADGRPSQSKQPKRGSVYYCKTDTEVGCENEVPPSEALLHMFLDSKINLLLVFIPVAYWAHVFGWDGGAVFVVTFLAMVPLASMLGVFTEELAAHTSDVVGGLINATFGNAVELVVAIQALMQGDFLVVRASLVGSVFSNLLLVLGMCFLCGGYYNSEQMFVPQGAMASIALLAFSGLTLLMPIFFGEPGDGKGGGIDAEELQISRIGSALLILMYVQLLFFQLKTHAHLFEGEGDVLKVIPFSWAMTGLVVITAMVTILSEWLVESIDGFCEEFHLGRAFVGVIVLPVVGNAVEHISAVSVAMKDKMDLALGVALGSAVQIALFVLPLVVVVGWLADREMSLRFSTVEVYLYLLSVFIVSLCLSTQRTNWLEGSLLVFTYAMIAVGVYFE